MDPLNTTDNTMSIAEASFAGKFASNAIIFLMAVIPLYFGSLRSLANKKKGKNLEILEFKDCYMFPVNASAALFSLYIIFKFLPKEIINSLINIFFSISGFFTLSKVLIDCFDYLMPKFFANTKFSITITEEPEEKKKEDENEKKEEPFVFNFETKHYPLIIFSLAVTLGYGITKNWIFNNIFGVAFAMAALEVLLLGNFYNGFLLLGGLFFYDIFWVFGTDVMVTVAKNFDAPIKVTFPRDIFSDGFITSKLSMLGLGDIVIPGCFVSMLYRFDDTLNSKLGKKFYFHVGYASYIFGLLLTYLVMHIFNHAQPALLYLSPTCTLIPVAVAFMNGDLKKMLSYNDTETKPNVIKTAVKEEKIKTK